MSTPTLRISLAVLAALLGEVKDWCWALGLWNW